MASSLGGDWASVIASIGALSGVYEAGNIILSLGMIGALRRKAAWGLSGCRNLLDLGAGPGLMSKAAGCCDGRPGSVMLDILPWSRRTCVNSEGVRGMYEWLPFRDDAFECVVAGFSLRDSWNLGAAIIEVRRVMRRGGVFIVLDLGKPDGRLKRMIITAYWRGASKLLAILTGPFTQLFGKLELTYLAMPRNEFVLRSFRKVFGHASMWKLLFGGVIITVAVKLL